MIAHKGFFYVYVKKKKDNLENQIDIRSPKFPKIHSELSSRTHGITVINIGSLSF